MLQYMVYKVILAYLLESYSNLKHSASPCLWKFPFPSPEELIPHQPWKCTHKFYVWQERQESELIKVLWKFWWGFFETYFWSLEKSIKYLCLVKIRSYCPNGYWLWNRFFHHLNCKARLVHIFCLPFHRILQYPPHFFEMQLLITSSQ